MSAQELNVPYNVKVYLRDPIAAPQELKEVHPLGKVSNPEGSR